MFLYYVRINMDLADKSPKFCFNSGARNRIFFKLIFDQANYNDRNTHVYNFVNVTISQSSHT